MSPDNFIAGWNATDDDAVVPVRESSAPVTEAKQVGPAADIATGNADHIVLRHATVAVNPASMRLSAILGVVLVLGAIGLHFGFGNILGDLTGEDSDTSTTVEITTDGTFSPDTITLHPRDRLTLTNKNPDPQVIKSTNETELFPVQVLFDTSFEFTVPDDASGTFTYFSETLPDDKTLTIIITPLVTETEGALDPPVEDFMDIPLPFVDDLPLTTESSSSSSVPTVSIQKTEHSSETATISLTGNDAPTSSEVSANDSLSNIPVNPYTVSTGLEQENRIQAIAEAAKKSQNLHSGAPLQEMVKHKPKTVTETGPAGALMLILPAIFGVALLYRKLRIA